MRKENYEVEKENMEQLQETKRFRCLVTFSVNLDAETQFQALQKASELAPTAMKESDPEVRVVNAEAIALVNNSNTNAYHIIPMKPITWSDIQTIWHNQTIYGFNMKLMGVLGNVAEERSLFMTNKEATIVLRKLKKKIGRKVMDSVKELVIEHFTQELLHKHEDGLFFEEEEE
jgi:alanine-alpha-ketoisovalerate/valine-pyruvate aminotransferase